MTNVTVVLVCPRNPLNIGAAARAMSNFGFGDLRLVEPYRVAVDEARSGVNADAVLKDAREFSTVAEAIGDCHLVIGTTALGPREVTLPYKSLIDAAKQTRRSKGRVALLFGSEKFGLSNEDMSHCHLLTRIPTRLEHRSMNLGQAVAVTLYEVLRSAQAAKARPETSESVVREFLRSTAQPPSEGPVRAASSEANERVAKLLLEALAESGYTKPPVDVSQEVKTRRLIRRMGLAESDAAVLQGMLRQLLWKIRR